MDTDPFPPSTNPLEAEILATEQQLRSAVLACDVERLSELLADDVLFVGPTGHLLTKAADLEAHRSGQLRVQSLEPLEIEMRVVGEGGAVVLAVSRLHLTGTFGGVAFAGEFRYTRLWQRGELGWRVAGGHCSAVV